mmetsp:Transcript_35976/g.81911  ORF Transcript_35976/g.81911 Transcript_35976/m.81911 type:complete len:343 (-) Transcript_35976:38-1066(-)
MEPTEETPLTGSQPEQRPTVCNVVIVYLLGVALTLLAQIGLVAAFVSVKYIIVWVAAAIVIIGLVFVAHHFAKPAPSSLKWRQFLRSRAVPVSIGVLAVLASIACAHDYKESTFLTVLPVLRNVDPSKKPQGEGFYHFINGSHVDLSLSGSYGQDDSVGATPQQESGSNAVLVCAAPVLLKKPGGPKSAPAPAPPSKPPAKGAAPTAAPTIIYYWFRWERAVGNTEEAGKAHCELDKKFTSGTQAWEGVGLVAWGEDTRDADRLAIQDASFKHHLKTGAKAIMVSPSASKHQQVVTSWLSTLLWLLVPPLWWILAAGIGYLVASKIWSVDQEFKTPESPTPA